MAFLPVAFGLFITIVTLIFIWLKHRQNYWKRRGIPHNKGHIIWGNMEEWRTKTQISIPYTACYKEFKGQAPFAGVDFLMGHFALLLDIKLVQKVLVKDFSNFDSRGIYINEKDDPLSANLFFMDGDKWRKLRPKMTPTFSSGRMKLMFNTVLGVGQELKNVFSEKFNETKDGVMDVNDLLSRYTADVIGICAFGLECNSLRNPKAEFLEAGKVFFTKPRHGLLVETFVQTFQDLARALHMKTIHDDVHNFYIRIVRETIAYREQNNVKRNDFMDMLIDMKNSPDGLTFEEVASQAAVFFIAGYETSSTTMSYALYELALNVEIQDKVRDHIEEVFAEHKNNFTYECMRDMHYLDKVIDETMRLHPILGHLNRCSRNRYETGDPKYYIEAGQQVIIPVLGIHHDPEFYPNPHVFDPERFSEEAIKSRPHCTYLPFGEGPRNCIGLRFGKMQAAIGLTMLLRNFKFSVAPETEIPPPLNLKGLVMNFDHGVKLKLERVPKEK